MLFIFFPLFLLLRLYITAVHLWPSGSFVCQVVKNQYANPIKDPVWPSTFPFRGCCWPVRLGLFFPNKSGEICPCLQAHQSFMQSWLSILSPLYSHLPQTSRPPSVVGWPMCLCVCPFFPLTWEACIPRVDSLSGLLDSYVCKIRCRHFRELNPSVLSGMKRGQHRGLAFSGPLDR